MTTGQELLIAAALLYLLDCLLILPRRAVLFSSLLGRRFCPHTLAHRPGTVETAVALAPPLPPLGCVFVAQSWPFSIAPEGLCVLAATPLEATGLPSDTGEFVPRTMFKHARAEGREVRVREVVVARCASAAAAGDWADWLRPLATLSDAEAAAAIDDRLAARFDARAAEEIISAARRERQGLVWSCNALFAWMFVVIPLVVYFRGFVTTWMVLLAGLLLLWITAVVHFRAAHRALWPAARRQRTARTFQLALTPLAAARAGDALTREALVDFEPLAVAGALCDGAVAREFGLRVARDMDFSAGLDAIVDRAPRDDVQARRVVGWFRARQRAAADGLFRGLGINAEAVQAPPIRDGDCTSYCPRCHSQYVVTEGTCTTCPAVALTRFAVAGSPGAGGLARGRGNPNDSAPAGDVYVSPAPTGERA